MWKTVSAALLGLLLLAAPVVAGMEGIVLRDMEGRRVPVDSLLTEGPVVLNFWATWCKPCRVEMPKLQELRKKLASESVHFAAVSIDTRRNKGRLDEYLEKNEVTLPVYRDPEGTLARKFRITAIPTTILLDQGAEIVFRTKGYRPGDEVLLKKEIEALIGEAGEETKQEDAPE